MRAWETEPMRESERTGWSSRRRLDGHMRPDVRALVLPCTNILKNDVRRITSPRKARQRQRQDQGETQVTTQVARKTCETLDAEGPRCLELVRFGWASNSCMKKYLRRPKMIWKPDIGAEAKSMEPRGIDDRALLSQRRCLRRKRTYTK